MSTVYLHVGQCGIQISKEYWKDVYKKSQKDEELKHTLFCASHPRALFIDAERKVIQKFIDETKKSKILKELKVSENSIRCRKGCGSNWAMGYHGLKKHVIGGDLPQIQAGFGRFLIDKGSSMLDVCTEAIRTKIEGCDSFSGFVGVNSLAGGTGSGWGSRLCEELLDLYPTAYRLWNVVAPHADGESPTQHYNQLLSLSKLHQCSDVIVLFKNDRVLDSVTRRSPDNRGSIADMNKLISKTLQGMYLPVTSLTSRVGGMSIGIEPWEMLRSVAPVPSYKFLQTSHADLSYNDCTLDVWNKLLRNAITSFGGSSNDRCSNVLCICRGIEKSSPPELHRIATKLKNSLHCVEWNPYPVDIWLDESKKVLKEMGYSKSVTLSVNCSSVAKYLKKVHNKSRIMFDSRAFLHWYARHGLSEEDFFDAFETISTVTSEYEQL